MDLNTSTFQITSLTERIKKLEDVVYKKSKKTETTRAQQMLILKKSGILDYIDSWGLKKNGKAQFLAALLNRSVDNIEDDLTCILSDNSPLNTDSNLEVVKELFKNTGLRDKTDPAYNTLKNLQKKG